MKAGRTLALIRAREELSAARKGILIAADRLGEPPSREQLQHYAVATSRALSRLDDLIALVQVELQGASKSPE